MKYEDMTIRQLITECEKMTKQLKEYEKRINRMTTLKESVEILGRQNKRLKKDNERYRKLLDRNPKHNFDEKLFYDVCEEMGLEIVNLDEHPEYAETFMKGFENTWISVSDILPSDRRDYLLTDGEHCYVGHYRPDARAWDHSELGWVQYCYADGSVEEVNITHWMPLPELPTEFFGGD